MRSCIIQPPYSRDLALSDEYFAYKIDMLDKVEESVDILEFLADKRKKRTTFVIRYHLNGA